MIELTDRRMSRRQVLILGGAALGTLSIPRGILGLDPSFPLPEPTRVALEQSPLVYVSPLRSNGDESTCHGEVWFVADGGDLLVVTAADRWRARAIRRGLDRARLWVGDFGVWKRADGRFRSAPTLLARATLEKDPSIRERALAAFGAKYAEEWSKWGPRFRDGLADGSRVLIRYHPTGE